ncbi:hypothetical protein T11_2460 [Trichinella zimbabwensis]|uniref:Uncharacterized protein n=1 Tax=Trichinella zimbabwensis TaxID=268475 RepID=A0A0V1HHY0_9BILA|nr:hypothetical protein T11_2460 [Trichinella zimbabwensis]
MNNETKRWKSVVKCTEWRVWIVENINKEKHFFSALFGCHSMRGCNFFEEEWILDSLMGQFDRNISLLQCANSKYAQEFCRMLFVCSLSSNVAHQSGAIGCLGWFLEFCIILPRNVYSLHDIGR